MNFDAVADLKLAAQVSARQAETATQGTNSQDTEVLDTAIRSTRENTQNTLANLAESTRGKLIAYGSKVVWPGLTPTVTPKSGTNLPFYLVVYADISVTSTPHLALELSRNGQVVGRTSLETARLGGDQDGRITYLGAIPVGSLGPGDYVIRFIAQQGSETAEESDPLTVQ